MKKQIIPIVLLLATLLFVQCSENVNETPNLPDNTLDCSINEQPCDLVNTINEFGFEVFQSLHEAEQDENSFIAPMSISTAISMVLNGADGDTKTAIQNTLNLKDWQMDEINKAYLTLLSQLPALDEAVRLEIANSIWYREGFDVLPAFLDVNSEFYKSEIRELDFLKPEAVNVINAWVEDKTEGLIDEILKEIPAEAVMYLINAIYFQGDWTNAFDPEMNYNSNFSTNQGEVETEFMTLGKKHLAYFENDLFQSVSLPYGDSLFSMNIYLPKPDQSLNQVIEALSTANWRNWNAQYGATEILFSMPKFELAYEKKLNDVLTDLGMGVAFTGKADFTKINSNGQLSISEVRHKSFITVDEKGTEAAAVTIIGVELTSVPLHPIMTVDRPFLFVIRDHTTNSALFIGKVNNPASE